MYYIFIHHVANFYTLFTKQNCDLLKISVKVCHRFGKQSHLLSKVKTSDLRTKLHENLGISKRVK